MSDTGGPVDDGGIVAGGDPMALFAAWMKQASTTEPNEANAMSVASVDADGRPNVRMVLLKDADARGFVFYTNLESAKGRELARPARTPHCAFTGRRSVNKSACAGR